MRVEGCRLLFDLGFRNRPDDDQGVLRVEVLFGHTEDIVLGDLFDSFRITRKSSPSQGCTAPPGRGTLANLALESMRSGKLPTMKDFASPSS